MLITTQKILHTKLIAHQQLSGTYGPSRALHREFFSDELGGLWSICGQNWCIGGDFNVIREVREKCKSSTITRSMKVFDGLIREMGLKYLPLRNAMFTRTNQREVPI